MTRAGWPIRQYRKIQNIYRNSEKYIVYYTCVVDNMYLLVFYYYYYLHLINERQW